MTTRELIKHLKHYPDDTPIVMVDPAAGSYNPVTPVFIECTPTEGGNLVLQVCSPSQLKMVPFAPSCGAS